MFRGKRLVQDQRRDEPALAAAVSTGAFPARKTMMMMVRGSAAGTPGISWVARAWPTVVTRKLSWPRWLAEQVGSQVGESRGGAGGGQRAGGRKQDQHGGEGAGAGRPGWRRRGRGGHHRPLTVAAATLREWLPDGHAGALLRDLGLIAATGGTSLNGDSNGIR